MKDYLQAMKRWFEALLRAAGLEKTTDAEAAHWQVQLAKSGGCVVLRLIPSSQSSVKI